MARAGRGGKGEGEGEARMLLLATSCRSLVVFFLVLLVFSFPSAEGFCRFLPQSYSSPGVVVVIWTRRVGCGYLERLRRGCAGKDDEG